MRTVWDWRRGSKQIAGPSWNGTIPVVNFGLACSPAKAPKGAQEFVVYSGKSMKWWALTNTLDSRAASFGTDMPPEEIRCAAYLEDGACARTLPLLSYYLVALDVCCVWAGVYARTERRRACMCVRVRGAQGGC